MSPSSASQPDAALDGAPPSLLRDVFDLSKPRLSSLVLVTGGGGLWLSGQPVGWELALVTLGGLTLVVGAANAMNNYLERDLDRLMARTRNRPLPAGRLDPRVALVMSAVVAPLSVLLLSLGANPLSGMLAALAYVLYVFVYTPMKRRSHYNILVGAVPGAMPPLIGWTAASGALEPGGLALFAVMVLWQIPHSIAIQLFRKAEYAAAGMRVVPLAVGDVAARRQAIGWALLLLLVSLLLVPAGVGGAITAVGGGLLGLGFFLRTLRPAQPDAYGAWGRRVFFDSLWYLTTLMAVLALDQALA